MKFCCINEMKNTMRANKQTELGRIGSSSYGSSPKNGDTAAPMNTNNTSGTNEINGSNPTTPIVTGTDPNEFIEQAKNQRAMQLSEHYQIDFDKVKELQSLGLKDNEVIEQILVIKQMESYEIQKQAYTEIGSLFLPLYL